MGGVEIQIRRRPRRDDQQQGQGVDQQDRAEAALEGAAAATRGGISLH
jgi:hypothetical protein